MTRAQHGLSALKASTQMLNCLGLAGAEMYVCADQALLAGTETSLSPTEIEQHNEAGGNGTTCVAARWWYRRELKLGGQACPASLHVAALAPVNNGDALDLLRNTIEREWLHAETVESLSVELGNRYEELNLLYGIDQNLDNGPEKPLRELIATMLHDVVDFLDIDGASVWAPAFGLTERAFDDFDDVLEALVIDDRERAIKTTVRGRTTPLVLNGVDAEGKAADLLELPYRAVAAPIAQGGRHGTGVLCLMRNFSHGPFTNGDRKLAQVLAAEVSKLLDVRYDNVTGLMNRETFEKLLGAGDAVAGNYSGSLVHIDLDQFKLINETCGHEAGDRLLRGSANLLRKVAPPNAIIARIGADEFSLLLPGISPEQTGMLAEKAQQIFSNERFIEGSKSFQVSACTGITSFSNSDELGVALIQAEIACMTAKDLGGARVRIYQAGDQQVAERNTALRWAEVIRSALEEHRFELFAQAISKTNDPYGVPAHYEVLLRMRDEEDNMVSPAIFIPIAERFGLIPSIDRYVVTQAVERLCNYQQKNRDIKLTVNLSGASLGDENFGGFVQKLLANNPIVRGSLSFEITETTAISNVSEAMKFISEMQAYGCRFLLDDFGAGMSSYAYLRQFPVDYVKIDGSFVKNIDTDPFNRSIVESIHQICTVTGKKTVAEFVETESCLQVLQAIGVDYAQGYLLDKPSPLGDKLANELPALKAVS